MCDYTNNFLCIRKLSKIYNISEEKIRQIIIDNNLEIKIIYISKENEEKIIDMYVNMKMKITKDPIGLYEIKLQKNVTMIFSTKKQAERKLKELI